MITTRAKRWPAGVIQSVDTSTRGQSVWVPQPSLQSKNEIKIVSRPECVAGANPLHTAVYGNPEAKRRANGCRDHLGQTELTLCAVLETAKGLCVCFATLYFWYRNLRSPSALDLTKLALQVRRVYYPTAIQLAIDQRISSSLVAGNGGACNGAVGEIGACQVGQAACWKDLWALPTGGVGRFGSAL